jgi:hypothetical protein
MTLAWLGIDQVLVVLFAFALPVVFLFAVRNVLRHQEQREQQQPPVTKEH